MINKIKQCSSPNHKWCDPINEADILYRTQYLVLSRTLLEAMPKEWQHRFVELIDEIENEFDYDNPDWINTHYKVQAKDKKGRFTVDPWGKYRYPNTKWINSLRKKQHAI